MSALPFALCAEPVHGWQVDVSVRRNIDWVRDGILDLIDGYLDLSPGEMKTCLSSAHRSLRTIVEATSAAPDRARLGMVYADISALLLSYNLLGLDEIVSRMMVAAARLVTGGTYDLDDEPEALR